MHCGIVLIVVLITTYKRNVRLVLIACEVSVHSVGCLCNVGCDSVDYNNNRCIVGLCALIIDAIWYSIVTSSRKIS
jgi:hypothetical protein